VHAIIRTVLVAIAPLYALTAEAALRNIENAYETSPRLVSLPADQAGLLTVRECPRCASVTLRTGRQTRWMLGAGGPGEVTLAKFREASALNADRLLTVFYDIKTRLVTRVVLSAE